MLLPRRLPQSCVCSDSVLVAILFCAATLFAWRRPRSGTMVHAAWLLQYRQSSPIACASPPLCRRQRPASGWAGPAGLLGQQDRRCTRMDWTAYGHVLICAHRSCGRTLTCAHGCTRMVAHVPHRYARMRCARMRACALMVRSHGQRVYAYVRRWADAHASHAVLYAHVSFRALIYACLLWYARILRALYAHFTRLYRGYTRPWRTV